MTNKILIVYESTYGYIAQVANFLKDRLMEAGLDIDVIDVKRYKGLKVYPLEQYKGIVLGIFSGSGVSSFKKLKRTFLRKDLAQYRNDSHLVGVFTTRSFNITTLNEQEDEKFARYIIKKLGFTPDLCEVFKPVLNFSALSPIEPGDRKIIRFVCERDQKQLGIRLDYTGINDFRYWDNITAFADTFVSFLK